MALGVAVTPSPGIAGPAVSTPSMPSYSRASFGVQQVGTSLQVGQVVAAQPAYAGNYGGSFCGPTGVRGTAPGTPGVPMKAPMAQQPVIRRLNSQPHTSSAASLSMQPPAVYHQTSQPPPVASQMTSRGLPAAYTAAIAGAQVGYAADGLSRGVGPTEMMSAEDQERVLLQTRLLRQGCSEELLQAEVESLRRSVASQEDRILQLTKQLQVSHESERKLAVDLEASRSESSRLMDELQTERLVREQAEAASTELRLAAEMVGQAAAAQDKRASWQNTSQRASSSPSRRAPNTDRPATRAAAKEDARPAPEPQRETSRPPAPRREREPDTPNSNAGALPSGRRGSGRPQSAKDEIDGRLHEFLERSDAQRDCGLLFKRLNRGWYAFRRRDERGPQSNDRSVEISIVNGKLMAKLEPSTHDPGWNNGKLGTIERFCAAMSVL